MESHVHHQPQQADTPLARLLATARIERAGNVITITSDDWPEQIYSQLVEMNPLPREPVAVEPEPKPVTTPPPVTQTALETEDAEETEEN